MSRRLLRFTDLPPEPPAKRGAGARTRDFDEIYEPFDPAAAADQASRCSQCGIPFCQSGCPLQNNIPDWLQLAAEGRLEEAYAVSSATNPMPEVCGRICPQDRLCEGACVIEQSEHGAVTIGAVEKHITDTAWEEGWIGPIPVGADTGRSIGIIGAGPAGLAAAERLRALGHAVAVYDRHDRVGGLLIYGIPHFKLDKEIVARREERLRTGGVTFQMDCAVGDDVTLAELETRHDAVLIATGVYQPRALGLGDAGAPGRVAAMDFLTAANRAALGDAPSDHADGTLQAAGKHVVVVGGGDTAMDCVRTAVRQDAKSVTCLYRRDRENMPGSAREVRSAEEEGVVFAWLAQPKLISAGPEGLESVTAARMRLGPPDESGRRRPEPIPDAAAELPCDMLIEALGYGPEDLPGLFGAPELALDSPVGALSVRPIATPRRRMNGAGATAREGVFAAGDIVRGASLVVWALRDGLDVAEDIHAWLQTQDRAAAAE